MKTIILIFALSIGIQGKAQVAIGKSSVTNSSCLLEFGSEARGIRLPLVSNATAMTTSAGCLVFDTATGSFRFYNGAVWNDPKSGGTTGGAPSGSDIGDGVIIGANTTSATGGALILEATDKALVLPKVDDVARMQTPIRGLIVWDISRKQVAVYNGANWDYY